MRLKGQESDSMFLSRLLCAPREAMSERARFGLAIESNSIHCLAHVFDGEITVLFSLISPTQDAAISGIARRSDSRNSGSPAPGPSFRVAGHIRSPGWIILRPTRKNIGIALSRVVPSGKDPPRLRRLRISICPLPTIEGAALFLSLTRGKIGDESGGLLGGIISQCGGNST
jgi:hypothetical protein